MTPLSRSLLLPGLLLLSCGCQPEPTRPGKDDTGTVDTENPDSGDSGDTDLPDLPWNGEDLDETLARELSASRSVPEAFYDALGVLGVDAGDFNYPDAGATFAAIPTRLHWTDTLRHQGDTAPLFAFMIGDEVESALAAEQRLVLRDLIAAQSIFITRDSFLGLRYDEKITALDEDEPLLAALRAFYEHAPVDGATNLPKASWGEIEAQVALQVESLPEDARLPLALCIGGLLRVAELRDQALMGNGLVDAETWRDLASAFFRGDTGFSTHTHDYGTDAFPGVDFLTLAKAAQLAARVVESARTELESVELQPGAELELEGPLGTIRVTFEATTTIWDGQDARYFLALDAGGDDTWFDLIAVNRSFDQPVAVALDLAGDDLYRNSSTWSIDDATVTVSAARGQGAGLFGIALLDDAAGDDSYHASGICQGVGVFGAGMLLDHQGQDTYQGYYAAQGSASFGFGILLDLGDSADRYETLQMGQGYGGPMGMGWLVDQAGDDSYEAISDPIIWDWAGEGSNWSGSQGFGYGVRDGFFEAGAPIFSGGLGALLDLDGDDDYTCAVMCQAFGYAFGTGIFFDVSGDDDHLVTHKYALGSATHWAASAYVDLQGEDTYRNNDDDECIGEGYDASVAWHLDLGSENDTYILDNYGEFTLGVARHPALGVLINEGGDDLYQLPDSTYAIGTVTIDEGDRSGYLAGVPALGMFLDLGGKDQYAGAREDVGEGLEWRQINPLGGDWDAKLDFGYGLDSSE